MIFDLCSICYSKKRMTYIYCYNTDLCSVFICKSCLDKWFLENNKCPICIKDVETDSDTDIESNVQNISITINCDLNNYKRNIINCIKFTGFIMSLMLLGLCILSIIIINNVESDEFTGIIIDLCLHPIYYMLFLSIGTFTLCIVTMCFTGISKFYDTYIEEYE